MAIISIVGTSGVGKSFLVRQLSALTQNPAFFEGEEGTIPQEILESIFNDSNPIKRWKFFLERYKNNLERATLISKEQNIDCFVDGAIISAQAILTFEDDKYKNILSKMLADYEYLKSDFIILLTDSKEKLQEYFDLRSRDSESPNKAINRALKIQDAFISLVQKEKNAIILDRTKMDFSKYTDINRVLKKIESLK